ncbi:LacI family DNA-binding transcriptional regulator [Microlunatus soli]|uniref:Transcriptional regulator, LacI family n=1 Tax=Microlunatus soli TaxID=630515 RepID=A0A1H1ZHX5_9ACTN|nr:LacI family DNA-binding transcriptional regulator [Microlunatus soli]SDT33391.1 transcriptional regulator, LacI family [Microlunatus soli]
MAAGRRTTLGDLAEGLGLSANTVSRALSGKDGVSERTRSLVLAEARRTGYLPAEDVTRRSTSSRRPDGALSSTIAVTIPSATHVFSSELIGAIEAGARSAGYSLDVFTTEESAEVEQQIADMIIDHDLAGAIVIPVQGRSEPWASVAASGRPVVAASREVPGLDCDFVTADNGAGAYAAVRHLLAQGCRRIVQFEEDLAISTINHRREGFARAMAEQPDAVAHTILVPTRRYETSEPRWRATEAHRACLTFLDQPRDVTFDAIVTGDDYFALGALAALRERDISVPDQVRLVGYGDHPYSAWLDPPLTSIRIPTQLIGELAVSLLLQRIAGDSGPGVRRMIKPELIIRRSSVPSP